MDDQLFELLFERANKKARRNLVILRVGDTESLHRFWKKDISLDARNWDMMVSYYGSSGEYIVDFEDIIVRQMSYKYDAAYEAYENLRFLWRYDRVWFPDDDLKCTWSGINRLFEIAEEFSLDLCQPALTEDSFIAHPITVIKPGMVLRFSNFVEAMAPMFSRNALERCMHTFRGSFTAWGLDLIWPHLLGLPRAKIAIIDETPVTHTRKQGTGAIYQIAKDKGISPPEEAEMNFRKFGVRPSAMRVFGAIFSQN